MASTKFTQFGQASNTSETEISVGVKGGSNFKRLNNMTATTAPTATDDGSDGYTVGSTWFDTTTGTLYVCSDSTNGAAVWVAQKVPYLFFEALLTQTGTDAPVVTILHNNTGITWTEVYNAVGVFFLEPDIVPDFRNVSVYCTNGTSSGNIFAFWRDDKLNIRTELAGTPTNSILLNSAVEVRIYP